METLSAPRPGLALLRRLLQGAAPVVPDKYGELPAQELRFVLEFADSPGGLLNKMLDEEIAPGPADPAFDAARYELEIAALALAQAKFGGSIDTLSPEAKVEATRPSPQLLSPTSSEATWRRTRNWALRSSIASTTG